MPTNLYLLLIIAGLLSCSKPATPPLPTDDIDTWTGATYMRYGFKSPVNNKDVYYYLTFKKNRTYDNYIRYNQTEAPTSVETGTYVEIKNGFRFTLNGVDIPAQFQNSKLILNTSAGSLTYTRQ